MKRQGGNLSDQPPVKKSDVSGSGDLRSKIGAKLQTLLNGISTESRLYARSKRQLYKDLFGEPEYTPIIIDPTIVIKIEPDDEESSNSSTISTSQNFLKTAKSRLTELLNKQQDGSKRFKENEKENARYKCNSSSGRSSTFQSQASQKLQAQLSESLSKNRKNVSHKGCVKPSSHAASSQVPLKNLVVVVEDIMKSKSQTKFTHLLPTRHTASHGLNREIGPESSSGNKATKSFASNSQAGSCGYSHSIINTDANSDCSIIENNSEIDVTTLPTTDSTFMCDYSYQDVDSSSTPLNTEDSINRYHFIHEDDSEMLDDPCVPQVIVDIKEGEVVSTESTDISNLETDVVLLCERTPTHEVITLEDDDESEEIIEETHNCDQCGKQFRLKSLLNFHLKMHKTDLLKSSKSSSSSS